MGSISKDMKHSFYPFQTESGEEQSVIQGNRTMVKSLLLQQWRGLTNDEIEATDYSKTSLADLIERRYGIHHRLAENYLTNLERTLPLI